MARVNTKPLSGTRDFLALEVLRRKHVIDVIERIYQSYGFEPLETPTMERLDTLLGKYGEEGDQLIFRVAKRGAKLQSALETNPTRESIASDGLRYDLTVPLARVVAEYRGQLPRYFKRYQIAPVFRADRPARGRYREFYQCDLDIVGSSSPLVEVEVLSAGAQILQELGFAGTGESGFRLRINHRSVLSGIIEWAGIDSSQESDALVAIDKLDKIGLGGVERELLGRGIGGAESKKLLRLLADCPGDREEALVWLGSELEDSRVGSEGIAELKEILALAAGGPANEHIHFDPYLARGLSYYTGSIFEIEFPGLAGSGGAGGRYNNLIGMFVKQDLPACGLSLGLERIILIMEEREMFPDELAGRPQILVTIFDRESAPASLALAQRLRKEGFRVDLYPEDDRYGRQFRYAEERSIRYAALLGPDEIGNSTVGIKDLESGEQFDMKEDQVNYWLSERLC